MKIGFHSSRGAQSATALTAAGGQFEPDLHFTGLVSRNEVTLVNYLMERWSDGIVAYHIYLSSPVFFSIELQFHSGGSGQSQMIQCKQEYESAFTPSGNLKRIWVKRIEDLLKYYSHLADAVADVPEESVKPPRSHKCAS